MFGIAGENLTMRLRIQMFDAMLKQEIGWYDDRQHGVGALCARLSNDAAQVQGVSSATFLSALTNITSSSGNCGYYKRIIISIMCS